MRFLEGSLGSCNLSRSWLDSSGFASFPCLGRAFEADCIDPGADFSHSGIEHLGARGTLGLGWIGRWCGQNGRSGGYSGLLLGGGLLLVEIVILHLLKNYCKLGEGNLEVFGVHGGHS